MLLAGVFLVIALPAVVEPVAVQCSDCHHHPQHWVQGSSLPSSARSLDVATQNKQIDVPCCALLIGRTQVDATFGPAVHVLGDARFQPTTKLQR
jgi:hypothetical protein